MAVNELLAQLHEVAASPKKQLDKYLAEGKKVVAVAPVYTPQEIIHSMGLVPMGVWGADMEINEAKKRFAEEDPDHNVYIDTIAERLSYKFEPTGNPDPYHYDADGEIELGRLFGLALLENFLD